MPYHSYLLFHLFVVRRFMKNRRLERIKQERKRVKQIWKDMLKSKAQDTDFSSEPNQDLNTLGKDDAAKKLIKLPKHYQPTIF